MIILAMLTFGQSFKIIFTSSNGGTLRGQTIQPIPVYYETQPVTAIPNPGYHFVKWESTGLIKDDAILTTPTITITNRLFSSDIMSNITVTATFTVDTGEQVYAKKLLNEALASVKPLLLKNRYIRYHNNTYCMASIYDPVNSSEVYLSSIEPRIEIFQGKGINNITIEGKTPPRTILSELDIMNHVKPEDREWVGTATIDFKFSRGKGVIVFFAGSGHFN